VPAHPLAHYPGRLHFKRRHPRGLNSLQLGLLGACQSCLTLVLYRSWPTVYSAPRLSSVSAWGRRLPLDAAALSTPPTSSREVVGDTPLRPDRPSTQLWRLVCTAQRHQGGGRRPGDSRGAVHTKCQSEHSTTAPQPSPPHPSHLPAPCTNSPPRSGARAGCRSRRTRLGLGRAGR
jgi:hypothetical protein